MPIAATFFVLLSLVALAVIPMFVSAWFESVRRETEVALLPAWAEAARMETSTMQQAAATRAYLLSGDEFYRARFEVAGAIHQEAVSRLGLTVPLIGPAAQQHLQGAVRMATRWQEEHARALDGRISAEQYIEELPRLEALRDSLLVHLTGLEDEITRAGAEQAARAERALGLQRVISLALGALAFLAALSVGWFARRQWYLTEAIERSLDEQRTLRRDAQQAHDELLRVTESRARLMRGFGHDVKNPLGAADGYLQLLGEEVLGPLNQQQIRAVERASRSLNGALNLVDDLVDLARVETGRLEVARVPTDLCAVVREAVDEYSAQAEAKKLPLHLDLPEDFPLVATDGRRVRQVLGNLLSNAVKYTDQGAITLRLRLLDADPSTDTPRQAAIAVSDSGPGIPPDQQRLLFQEFVRLDPGKTPGAGLGLTISDRLARALGGAIAVESDVGRGSTFTLLLPLRRASDVDA